MANTFQTRKGFRYSSLPGVKKYGCLLVLELSYFCFGIINENDHFMLLLDANILFLGTPILIYLTKKIGTLPKQHLVNKNGGFFKIILGTTGKIIVYLLPVLTFIGLKEILPIKEKNFLEPIHLIINLIPLSILVILGG